MRVLALTVALSVLGCTGSGPEPKSSDELKESLTITEEPSEERAAGIPNRCFKAKGSCTPDWHFVKRLCGGNYPSVTLYLFSKFLPFTHAYLPITTKAINASGGLSSNEWIEFDEEVLVLYERKPDAGAIQMSNISGGWDVLRWNGDCVTLMDGELSFRKPPQPKAPKVDFRFLDETQKQALRSDADVNAAYLQRRNECKGAHMGKVTDLCVKADAKLSQAIVEYVRKGGKLPMPRKVP